MELDRRTLMLAGMLAMTSACAKASNPPKRAGHPAWAAFKASYVQPDGRVVDTGNGGISHSEGQGYAMLLAEAAGDRAAFMQIHGWTEKVLLRRDVALFSWRYDPKAPVPVSDPNNASDGDILIAWALLRAGQRWQDQALLARSTQIRTAIRGNLVRQAFGKTILLPGKTGFDAADRVTLNLSYYIWPALDAFAAADGGAAWSALIRDGEALVAQAQFGPLGLPTDWIDLTASGKPEPARGRAPQFGFDAVRIPLYLLLGNRKPATKRIAAFWKSYADRAQPIPAWVDVVTGEAAPYPLSAGGMAIVRRLIGQTAHGSAAGGAPDYYSSVLDALAQL